MSKEYAAALTALVVGLILIILLPAESLIALSVGVPVAIVLAGVSTFYLAAVYRWQPIPRSRFFRMLIESFVWLFIVGLWVGYLSLGRVLERAAASGAEVVTFPVPPPNISAPISALVVIIAFISPIRFALEVWRRRRRTSRTGRPDPDLNIDERP